MSLRLPAASELPGTDKPTVAVAVDAGGRLFFANQIVTENELKSHLALAQKNSREPLTLVIHADKAVTYDQLIHLTLLARDAGIHERCSPRCRGSPANPPAMKTISGEPVVAGEARLPARKPWPLEPLVDPYRAGFGRARRVDFHFRHAKTHHAHGCERCADAETGRRFERMAAAERPDAVRPAA